MIGDLGVPELLIILVLVVLLFGAGRVGRLGSDLGTAIKDFRKAVKDENDDGAGSASVQPSIAATTPTEAPTAPLSTTRAPADQESNAPSSRIF